MAYWSDKTQRALMAVNEAIANFVLEKWQSGSTREIAEAWRNFIDAESVDAMQQGYGKKNYTLHPMRGFRSVPVGAVEKMVPWIEGLTEKDRAERDRAWNELNVLMGYFDPWDWEESRPKMRGIVAQDGSVSSAAAMKIRFRILNELSDVQKKIADEQLEIIKKEAEKLARGVGSASGDKTLSEIIQGIYGVHGDKILIGVGALVAIIGLSVIRGRK